MQGKANESIYTYYHSCPALASMPFGKLYVRGPVADPVAVVVQKSMFLKYEKRVATLNEMATHLHVLQ